jgi:DNA (cytosine-5)-methyltransferase 1
MCHPTALRAITVGEAAAIQEFPREWKFVGSVAAKFRQVGNAVPTRLGRVTGEVLTTLLAQIRNSQPDAKPITVRSRIVHLRPHVRTRTVWKDGEVFAGDHCYYAKSTPSADEDQLGLGIDG